MSSDEDDGARSDDGCAPFFLLCGDLLLFT